MKQSIQSKAENQSKYNSYILVNPTLSPSKIYFLNTTTVKLQKTTQLRLISHSLKIESGRHRRPVIPKEERLCICGEIEDEEHFVLKCRLYCHIRQKYGVQSNDQMDCVLDSNYTCDYIYELFKCREILNPAENTRTDEQ